MPTIDTLYNATTLLRGASPSLQAQQEVSNGSGASGGSSGGATEGSTAWVPILLAIGLIGLCVLIKSYCARRCASKPGSYSDVGPGSGSGGVGAKMGKYRLVGDQPPSYGTGTSDESENWKDLTEVERYQDRINRSQSKGDVKINSSPKPLIHEWGK